MVRRGLEKEENCEEEYEVNLKTNRRRRRLRQRRIRRGQKQEANEEKECRKGRR
jgi:hypothetical protein